MAVVATLIGTSVATAQMPSTPTLQNAFAAGGITAALDYASAGATATYAAAAAWSPASARFQISAGAGVQARSGSPTRTTYGARVNVPVYGKTSAVGASVFAGYGGLTGGDIDSTVIRTLAPIGATISYRLAGGTGRGVSVYGSPVYEFVGRGGNAGSANTFRGALGLDLGLTRSIGISFGVELGNIYEPTSGKPSGTMFGLAASYALGR